MAIPQSAKTALQKKAKSSGISYGTLAKVSAVRNVKKIYANNL